MYSQKKYLASVDEYAKQVHARGLNVILPYTRQDLHDPHCIREEFFDKKGNLIEVGPKENIPVYEEMVPSKGGRYSIFDYEPKELVLKELRKGTPHTSIAQLLHKRRHPIPDEWRKRYGLVTWNQVLQERRARNTMKKNFSRLKQTNIIPSSRRSGRSV